MKRAVVCGASGLIGSHMVKRLRTEGYYVVGLSRTKPKDSVADDFWPCDLREPHPALFEKADVVYQFACEVGGIGFIANQANDATMLYNSTLIDMNVLEACRLNKVPEIFFASSACVYGVNKRFFAEADAYPAQCSNEFAWQKLFAERLYQSYARAYGIDIKIARLFNTYGIGMAWTGGREKSVAALCRKVAETVNGGTIKVWGSGQQTRSYMHVSDAIEGIWRLMHSRVNEPLNIGPQHEVSIHELVKIIGRIAGKTVFCEWGGGPTGVSRICSDNTLIKARLGWEPTTPVEEGMEEVFPWVEQMVLDNADKRNTL